MRYQYIYQTSPVYFSRLLWVDAWTKTLRSWDNTRGGHVTVVSDLALQAGDNAVFGLALDGGSAFISVWATGDILQVVPEEREVLQVLRGASNDVMFSLASLDPTNQPQGIFHVQIC